MFILERSCKDSPRYMYREGVEAEERGCRQRGVEATMVLKRDCS